jgi:hypothetical protein
LLHNFTFCHLSLWLNKVWKNYVSFSQTVHSYTVRSRLIPCLGQICRYKRPIFKFSPASVFSNKNKRLVLSTTMHTKPKVIKNGPKLANFVKTKIGQQLTLKRPVNHALLPSIHPSTHPSIHPHTKSTLRPTKDFQVNFVNTTWKPN